MRIPFRIRSFTPKQRLSSRISPARFARHNIGLKAPRGFGWFTNPRKALRNRIYYRTTLSVEEAGSSLLGSVGSCLGCLGIIAVLIGLFNAFSWWFIAIMFLLSMFAK